jgi:hypothetical protein
MEVTQTTIYVHISRERLEEDFEMGWNGSCYLWGWPLNEH